jgi:ATP-dependent exoDNAse (exonuclease V) beta subunit
MQRMESLFAGTDYKIVGDAEKYFQNAFYLVTLLLGFYVDVERSLSNGRIDMVAKTKDYIYIFEFKYDKSPEEALRQIDEKGYAKPYASDPRQLIKIGVNFSREKRCIEGWKVVRS